jgi:hypothetical protein
VSARKPRASAVVALNSAIRPSLDSSILNPNPKPKTKSAQSEDNSLTFAKKQERFHAGTVTEALPMLSVIEQTPTAALVTQADKIARLHATASKALQLEEHRLAVVVNVGLLHNFGECRCKLIQAGQTGRLGFD